MQILADANLLASAVTLSEADHELRYLLTDSRKVLFGPASLFFAFRTEKRTGVAFMPSLLAQGCKYFIVEERDAPVAQSYSDAVVLVVKNVLAALQHVATWHRQQFPIPVIAITGSNGKTIVKEWLAQMLGSQARVVKSPKSYNSQIGVPLSVWQMAAQHQIGIFEAGVSRAGEMATLAKIISPEIGIFTNLGAAHDEGFTSRAEKLAEKWQLMQDCATVILPSHYDLILNHALGQQKAGQTLVIWHYEVLRAGGQRNPSRVRIWMTTKSSDAENITKADYVIPFYDAASLENACCTIVAMQVLKYKGSTIQEALRGLRPVSMRLEFKEGIRGCYLIDDCYSNDLIGLTQALEFMNQQQVAGNLRLKTAILSDLLETGLEESELYAAVFKLLKDSKIDKVIAVGDRIGRRLKESGLDVLEFASTQLFLDSAAADAFDHELVLIKGARVFQFERIVQHLQAKAHGTRLEINLDAVAQNLDTYRQLLKPETKIMVMVKALAYGSGSYEIAKLLQLQGADYLAVAYADEGVQLREGGISIPIMVMNPAVESFEKLKQYHLEPVVYSMGLLQEWIRYAQAEAKQHYPGVHIELETGMNRLGFAQGQLKSLAKNIKAAGGLVQVKGIFSHLSAADEPEMEDFSQAQITLFGSLANELEQLLGYTTLKHLLNSPGITRFTDAQFDMVRLGIGLYGYDPNGKVQHLLQPVGRLKATISQVKEVKAGETIGYSRKGLAETDTRIATLSIGYADGFDRRLSNGLGVVKVNGKRVPVIGNVCMDMTMVNLGSVPAKEGDDAIIFDEELSIQEMAQKLGTIPYEILTKVSSRVKRIFYTEQS